MGRGPQLDTRDGGRIVSYSGGIRSSPTNDTADILGRYPPRAITEVLQRAALVIDGFFNHPSRTKVVGLLTRAEMTSNAFLRASYIEPISPCTSCRISVAGTGVDERSIVTMIRLP